MGRQDFETETETLIATAPTLLAQGNTTGGNRPPGTTVDTVDSLIVTPILDGAKGLSDRRGSRDGSALGAPGDPMFTLREGSAHAVAYMADDYATGSFCEVEQAGPLTTSADRTRSAPVVAFAQNQRDEVRTIDVAGALAAEPGMKQQTFVASATAYMPTRRFAADGEVDETFREREISDALHTSSGNGNKAPMIATSAVRRLTPRECERLQGFPDDYTLIPLRNANGKHNGKWSKDGPRYKALGNSMAVPVMRWIGQRIAAVDALT